VTAAEDRRIGFGVPSAMRPDHARHFSEWGWAMGRAVVGGIVGALACGFLGFAVLAASGGGWTFFLELIGILFGGLGGAIAPLVSGTDRTGPGRSPVGLRGRAIFWGIVAALALGLLCGGVLEGRDRVTQVAGIVYLALCGSIAPLVAWADRPGPGCASASLRAWFLGVGPLLLGAAILIWRFGRFSLNEANGSPIAPKATSPAAPLSPAFKPTTWWDVVQGDTTAAIAHALHVDFGGALAFLLCLGLATVFLAYGAFLGGRAVRFFVEQDGAKGGPLSPGFEEFTSFEKK
jgi:hypothetical protein